MSRTNLSAVVSRQLPEHIREDYPTFVAFVEAYYEYLQTQGVDFSTFRDIDQTLESFISQFKKELAYNLPNVVQDERFLLQHIKDQYLAKGSESSYKLLFRLLFGKEVELVYPGRSMLRASDGRWNQEVALFARVDFGNADEVVGKLVDIQTATRVIRVLVDRRQDIVGEVDRIVLIDPALEVYEFFLDKRFFGNVSPGDKIRYLDEFQATILPATRTLTVTQPGRNFRVGQVFELRSGTGTGALLKVTTVTPTGGIKYAELIKFGLGYTSDFAVSILAANSINAINSNVALPDVSSFIQNPTYISAGTGTLTASASSTSITGSGTDFGESGGPAIGDEIWTTDTEPKIIGVIKTITNTTSLVLAGIPSSYEDSISGTYTGSFTFRNMRNIGVPYEFGGAKFTYDSRITDRTLGFNEQGYVNLGDYVTFDYVDGTYSGSLIREFSANFRNSQTDSAEPAIIQLNLGALVKYPGYFETNNGFLDDSIFIQDGRYYQTFSYVLKIDERLDSYSSAVKTMLHPAGMALFGEFNITNNYDLSIALESLVKSLGIGLTSDQSVIDTGITSIIFSKTLSTTIDTPNDSNIVKSFSKQLDTSFDTPSDTLTQVFSKALTNSQDVLDSATVRLTGKVLTTQYTGMSDLVSSFDVTKELSDSQALEELHILETSKYVEDTLDPQTEEGYVGLNPYAGQDIFAAEYSVGSRASTFTTP